MFDLLLCILAMVHIAIIYHVGSFMNLQKCTFWITYQNNQKLITHKITGTTF